MFGSGRGRREEDSGTRLKAVLPVTNNPFLLLHYIDVFKLLAGWCENETALQ